MQVINLTPHTIAVINNDLGLSKVYKKSGTVIRTSLDYENVKLVDGFPVVTTRNLLSPLPAQKPDTVYIVSAVVLQQARYLGRTDFVAPDSNHASRDYAGNIISVPGWVI